MKGSTRLRRAVIAEFELFDTRSTRTIHEAYLTCAGEPGSLFQV
jgi:hypothetical protein